LLLTAKTQKRNLQGTEKCGAASKRSTAKNTRHKQIKPKRQLSTDRGKKTGKSGVRVEEGKRVRTVRVRQINDNSE